MIRASFHNNKICLFSILLTFLLYGCGSTIYFEKPMPQDAEVVRELPNSFDGIYLINFEDKEQFHGKYSYFEIKRINSNRCIIYGYEEIVIDSLDVVYGSPNSNDIVVELKGSYISITRNGSTEIIPNIEIVDNRVRTPKELAYEIDLEEGYYSAYSDEGKKVERNKCMLKKKGEVYYLNVLDEVMWYIMIFEQKEKDLQIVVTNLHKSDFKENRHYYEGITSIRQISDNQYLANPSDSELDILLTEPDLTARLLLKKQSGGFVFKPIYIAIAAGVFIVVVIIVAIYFSKKRKS